MVHRQISEFDWKLLRRLGPVALDRFCRGVLSEAALLASGSAEGSHARHLELLELVRGRDRKPGGACDDVGRSAAYVKLARMRSLGLMTGEELADFSEGTRTAAAPFQER